MEYAHAGELVVKTRAKENDPVPVDLRHGLKNAYTLAGHEDFEGDVTKLMYKKEGFVMRVYIVFVTRVLRPIYIFLTFPWILISTLAFFWIVTPILFALIQLARHLGPWIVDRAEKSKKRQLRRRTTEQRTAEAYTEVSKSLYDADLPELQDDDAIFYMMLDTETETSQTSLTFTRDASQNIFEAGEGNSKTNKTSGEETTTQSFEKGAKIKACETLTYSALCVDRAKPHKRIQVAWTVSLQTGTKLAMYDKKGFVPLDAVVPTFSRETARERYAAEVRAYHYTGTTTWAWHSFFELPLISTFWLSLTVTLGVRFVVTGYCWPLELVPQLWPLGIGGAYMHSIVTSLQERTLVGFVRPLAERLMKNAFKTIEFAALFL